MKSSSDVWFCAYLMSLGFKIEKYDTIDRGRVKCYFNISDEKWKECKLNFNNSDIIKFKGLIEQIKDLCY